MSLQENVDAWTDSHREWMKNATLPCGHHEMYTGKNGCVSCKMEAGFLSLEDALEEAYPEYHGHKISCPFFGLDYDHCDCETANGARVIVEGMEACGDCEHVRGYHDDNGCTVSTGAASICKCECRTESGARFVGETKH